MKKILKGIIRKKTVLIIDDEEDFSFFLKSNLEDTGRYKVYTSGNGHSGLKIAQSKKPDVVLLDIVMPHMDGFEVLDRMKGNVKTYDIPVIMLTALDNKNCRSEARAGFAGDYLVKPVELDRLISTIERVAIYGQ